MLVSFFLEFPSLCPSSESTLLHQGWFEYFHSNMRKKVQLLKLNQRDWMVNSVLINHCLLYFKNNEFTLKANSKVYRQCTS